MALSHFTGYLNRTARVLRDNSSKMMRMSGADLPDMSPLTLWTFNSLEDISHFATGCDADVGGLSSVRLSLDESPKHNLSIGQKATGKFWGEMRLAVKPGLQGKIRPGYAGFRSKPRSTLFGEILDDLTWYKYLEFRVRCAGHPRTRNSYFVNLQTDGPVTSDLWQHRLFFGREDGGWEDVYLPLDAFVLTNSGEVVNHQITMARDKIRTIGISLLGGNSGVEGAYELGINSIRAVNEEDVVQSPESSEKAKFDTAEKEVVPSP